MLVVLFLTCFYLIHSQSLDSFLRGGLYCSRVSMINAYQASTNVGWKINGTNPYTLFSLCGDTLSFTDATLNYHLVKGLHPVSSLTQDLVLTSESGDNIRFTTYSGVWFANGRAMLESTYPAYAENITNGVFYTINTGQSRPDLPTLSAENSTSILSSLGNIASASTSAAIFAWSAYIAPTTGWTVFLPNDNALSTLPQYLVDYLLNDVAEALNFVQTHSVTGSQFATPLKAGSPIPSSTTVTSLNGVAYDLSYINSEYHTFLASGTTEALLVEEDLLRSDGVIHVIDNYFINPKYQYPKPTVSEFVAQYSKFSPELKNQLLGFVGGSNGLEAMIGAFVANPSINIPSPCTLFLVRNFSYTTQLNTDELKYHILSESYSNTTFPFDELLTTQNGAELITSNYARVYINGYASIVSSIALYDGYVHILDRTLKLPLASNDPCGDCFKSSTVVEDIPTQEQLAIFSAIVTMHGLTLTPPFTLLVPVTNFWYVGDNKGFNDYLLGNSSAWAEFIDKLLIESYVFPVIAKDNDVGVPITSKGGISYNFLPFSLSQAILTSESNSGGISSIVRQRSDGIYYPIGEYMFPFAMNSGFVPGPGAIGGGGPGSAPTPPVAPVEPTTTPSGPTPTPPDGPKSTPTASSSSRTLVSLVFFVALRLWLCFRD